MAEHFDILIVGGGPAGLTAALYARRAGKTALILEKGVPGGQITLSHRVDNYPGAAGLSGLELADRMAAQAIDAGAKLVTDTVTGIRDGAQKIAVTSGGTYSGHALILASGMHHRALGLPGEDRLSGISYCAVCDGAFYRGKHAAVCGGGNTALQDALFLSDLCSQVTLIHRRDTFRGEPVLLEQLRRRKNVSFRTETTIAALHGGDGALHALTLHGVKDGQEDLLAVDGLFVAVGYQPDTGFAGELAITDSGGFFSAGEDCRTGRSGIFAAGDCRTKDVRQLLTACADGAAAAIAACRYCQ